uniref:Msx2-interacting protein n=1 Tax=Pygocentrus nattereri TaxID=42514 RepID=A0AAR2L353_PYGNA
MVRETRHLWVGNLPEHVREEKIVEHFKRYGRVESVKVLRKRGSEGGVAAFVDFVDIKSAQKAHNAVNKMGDRDLRTDYNEPGSVPSAVRGLDDNSPSSSHGREVAGFSRGAVGPVYGPPVSLHTREGRYERRLDGSSDSRDRAYEHSPYGHHERGGTFDRPRHYNTDYYRDRTMFASGVASSPAVSAISGGFDTPETHFESRIRDPFTLSSSARRDPYRDDRGRRVDRTYHHRRSRSSHSSQSRHPSPQRTTGQTPKTPHSPKRSAVSPGRGPRSRSRSRSSSSDSVSSTSSTGSGSDSNSSSSEGSRARSVQSAATHVPVAPPPLSLDCDEPRRSFGIRVQNLPVRSTDTSLKDGLFHEFKKYGKVTSVQIHGASEERYGLVFFRQQEDQEKALSVSKGKLFFGMLIEVTAWNGPETESENEFRPLDGRIDEFHPKATRTLFIGNLEKTTNYQQLLDVFQRFGEIVDIDIKRVNGVPQYAFVQYSDIASVCKAIKKMDGEYLGTNRLKLGFGKSMPTTCVWLDGLSANITEQYLTRHFCRYGHVVKVVLDRMKGMALILYNNTDFAQAAVRETKGWKIGGNKIKVDFASQESQMAFYRSMQASGQDIRDFYEIPSDRRDERRPPYHEFSAERAYYENVRTPGIYAEDPRRDYPARSRERYTELDHYQGDHYDPRYHEDPREYRDYRDPFEQDIRKYSYIQRERERERERFEADRGRWSPSHQRRPITPSASPSPSDRVSREAERRVYRHSSERSGSCSSLSPAQPQFEKPEKSPVDYKTESLEREVEQAEAERVSGAEKNKRGRRKEKTDREKGEKAKSRRGKVPSPSIPRAEADREPSLDSNSGKIKVSDVDGLERPRHKGDNEPSPSDPVLRLEPQKGERLDQSKSEPVDRDCKGRSKKHLKSDPANEVKEPLLDSDRLAARKRRFGDPSCKTIRQKRGRVEDEQTGGVSQPADFGANASFTKEAENDAKTLEKEAQKREHSKSKSERIAHFSQREELDPSMRVEFQSSSVRQGEHSETNLESLDSKPQPGPSIPRRVSKDGTPEKDSKGREEYLDIDLSQSYRKQMEQNRRLRQQLQEPDKPGKAETPHCVDTEDLENRSLVHEVGKPPQDVTDNSPPSKSKKQEHFDLDVGAKRERVYRTSRPKNEETDWNNTHSPRFQHAPQHAEDEYTEVPHLITGKEVKELPKPEDNAHPDTDVAVKRVHTSQMSKQSTPLLDEQQRRWENRLKQDLLPDFSRSSEKRRLNRKFLEYGLWPDLEPGEVRSDSEEDREHKPNSPMPSTSVSFPERHRGDRLSDSKLTTSLERNKFYSFALDQTITPDTKALLERAKSLSSSREDNWSFLDGDSHFASFRSRKDTEKVESTPRPTPSWYMKKKKIRSESEDKIDDRKEDPKPEEQERRELFASRFLHSSIFEQDSKRLQHLERKHEDPEHGMGYPNAQQSQTEGQPDSEPVVLFHDRFLELTRLQQQKGKEKSEQESKKDEIVDGRVDEKSQEEEEPAHQRNTVEPNVQQAEIKPISPAQAPQASPAQIPNVNSAQEIQVSAPVLTVKEMSPLLEASNVQVPSPKHLDPQVKEEKQPEQIFTTASFSQETSESNGSECQETKPSVSEVKVSPTNDVTTPLNRDVEQSSSNDTHTDDTPCVDSYPKAKASPTTPVAPLTSPNTPDKQSTRKSERIDREKLKRSSSPRGELSKTVLDKSTGKSPIHSADTEQSVEQNVPPVRARRRNVRSVYATVVEGESAPQTNKDVESPRSARKRGSDKESLTQQQPEPDVPTAPATSRRGRPPKNRRQGEDFLSGKNERSKLTETKETDANESTRISETKQEKDKITQMDKGIDVMGDGDTKEDNVMAATKVRDPPEALSRELELEQAVENIAKLTEDPTPLQFKSPTEVQPPLSVLVEEPVHEPEEDKPANPASETELAAAIDSITSEDMSSSLPQDQVNSVIDSDSDIQTLVPDVKVDERNSATIREETSNTGTSRKGGKGRAKAQKRAKGQKANVTKKEANKEVILETESLPVKSLEAIPKLPAVTETSPPATAAVITPSSKQDISLTGNVPDVSKATEVPLKEQPDLPKSSGPAANKSPTSLKPQPHPYECTSPSLSPTSICLKSSHLSRLPVSPTDRLTQPKEAAVLSPSITPSAPSDNPTLLPDSSPSDTNTSDLRKILSKPRNIPIPDIAAAPGSMHTRESDAKNAHENRQASLSTQPVVRPSASLPSPETKQVFSEKSVISVIASTATSVISRVCNPSDSEEKPSIPMGNPFMDKPPKQMYQPSMDDSSTYHGPTVGEEGGNAGRYIVDNTPLSTGPTAGLRVNTSEGVVVLSHSGQKIEGRQRISAKISQIPPPSAVDIESQQLVSMPQIKQDLYSASQPATPKGSLPPSDHGHSLKSQPNVPSIKSDSGLDKLDTYAPVQSGVVKRLQQTGPSQVMGFHHSEYGMVMKHPKKEGNEPLNVENVKPAWVSTISPAISPHLPSPAGNVGFIPGTPTDRASSHIQSKQEPRSPRKSGHPHSPFVSSPIGSSSPKGVSMVLSTGLPTMSQYVPSVHHSEQSVIIMSPHRVAQTIPIGHLSQGDVRVNTPPLSMMSYGIHSEGLPSTWPPGQQRPTSPQAVGNREMVLKVNPANARGHEGGEEEARRFHQALGRPPATQLKPESIPAEYRGPIHSGLPLERFNVSPRDMRMLMHHQQGERPASELHQGHLAEAVAPTSTPTSITASLSPRAHLLQKTVAEKDPLKQSELKRTTSPPGKDGMMGIRSAVPSMASPQRVQLIPSGPVPPFSEYSTMYTNLRTVHSQFSESSPLGMAQPPPFFFFGTINLCNCFSLKQKYPIVWQGLLALKNDTAAVQLHFVCGNKSLGLRSLPVPETGALLRIVQRMRLETPQLEGVARRMTGESDFCLLLAMPCGVDQEDVVNQTQALKSAFINYLKAKLAAGIINVPNPGSNQPAYVLQIFPPCEFSESHLSRLAPDLLSQISSISPHLMIVITSV